MKSHRNRLIVRTWQVLQHIQRAAATLDELARDLEVSTRTIRRDLEALDLAGFPLYNEKCDDGEIRWHLVRQGLVPRRMA